MITLDHRQGIHFHSRRVRQAEYLLNKTGGVKVLD
jgi:hypothetical protein